MKVSEFTETYLKDLASAELANIKNTLQSIYESTDYDDLEDAVKKYIDELNLEDLLSTELAKDDPDIVFIRFLLRRLSQLNDSDIIVRVAQSLPRSYALVGDIVEYLNSLTGVDDLNQFFVGDVVMNVIQTASIAHLPFHRYWLLSLFGKSELWGQSEHFVMMYNQATDSFTRRELILAMGRSVQDFWFRAHKSNVHGMEPWERRAFLYGASALPSDERKYWYDSLKLHLDPLDEAVIKLAKQAPFGN